MQLILVRHGESSGNITQVLQGRDELLTERGRAQAHAAGASLAQRYRVRALYASPLARAAETARIIGSAIGFEPELREPLAEINVGYAAGLTYRGWVEAHPDQYELWQADGIDYVWPGGESGRQLGQRIAAEIDQIIAHHRADDGAVVVVSHGGALAWAMRHLLGETHEEWPRHEFDNCSVTEVLVGASTGGEIQFVCRNDIAHLSVVPNEEVATGRG
jgi:broad specificity phosphatase PhoE